jgi:1-acyl-sn-glycerol-3-phosphate acyltransferase
LRFLLKRLVGSISKSKSKSDFYTIRQITDVVRKQNGIVGLFPEGRRTWDGQTLPLMYATAKLIRMLKVPVVCCVLEGGYHSLPRWSNERRRGQLTVAFQEPWKPEEFKDMSVETIFQELTRRLSYNAYDYQKKNRIIFKSNTRAQYLEHVLYLCPQCYHTAELVSRGNTFFCTQCGLKVDIDAYGFFMSEKGKFRFSTVAEWNSWQRDYMKKQFAGKKWDDTEVIFSDNDVIHLIGYRDRRMKRQGIAWIGFTPIGFQVKDTKGTHWYRFDELDSLAVSMQRNVEFYTKDTLHRFRFPGPNRSAYKYLSAYECLVEVSSNLKDRNLR